MKKRNLLKRIAAVAMSAAMLLGMSGAVSAAPAPDLTQTGSLTIVKKDSTEAHNPIEGVTFNYAKIGGFETDAQGNVTGYSITDDTLENILTADGGLTPIAGTTVYDGKAIQDALTSALVTKEDEIVALATQRFGTTNAEGEATNSAVTELGLYLLAEVSAPVGVQEFCAPFIVSIPILSGEGENQNWEYNVTAIPKNTLSGTPTGDKEIVDIEGSQDETNASANVGDTVTFKITSQVPGGEGTLEKYIIRDTMSAGLAFDYDSVVIKGFVEEEDPAADAGTTLTATVAPNGDTDGTTATDITFTFEDPDNTLKNIYKTVVITYDATITKEALKSDEITNEAGLDYKNDDTIDVNFTEVPVKVDIYGYQFTKTDADKKGLAGAEFKLYSDEECKNEVDVYDADGNQLEDNTIVSGTNGIASFYGLAAGTYYLKEISAPDGYTALTEPVKIIVSADSANSSQIDIVNTKGFTLPTTGGMGTTIFTIGGVILMAGAAVLIIRMNRKEREN